LVGFHRATKIKWLPDASDETELLTGTAIVTGGTGGLGAAVVARLLDDGWRVVVPWVVEEELSRVPERDGLELVRADLFDADEVATVVAHGVADSGAPLRGLVNLVGGFAAGARVDETPIEEFEKQFRLNLRPTYLMIHSAVPQLVAAGGGSIVCVGTRAALQPFSGAAGYIASKAAVIAFANAVATEYKQDRVRCNTILPSVIDTPANRVAMPKADHEKWVKPAAIAGVIASLLSDDSEPTSGAAIPVYGRA
jgi:NAD(P)-dependent dehydrogenase (short-subunit alcohol dehydrogenase family)